MAEVATPGDAGLVAHTTALAVGLASLALALDLRRLAPVVPGSLVAVLAGIVAVGLFDLDAHGVAMARDEQGARSRHHIREAPVRGLAPTS